jgi:hypothetical protein
VLSLPVKIIITLRTKKNGAIEEKLTIKERRTNLIMLVRYNSKTILYLKV